MLHASANSRRLQAAQDAEAIAEHIAKCRVEAAIRFLENTESTLRDLADFPGGGIPFETDHPELANLRVRRVKEFPNHLIFYVQHHDAVEVVRILHGAQDLDTELGKPIDLSRTIGTLAWSAIRLESEALSRLELEVTTWNVLVRNLHRAMSVLCSSHQNDCQETTMASGINRRPVTVYHHHRSIRAAMCFVELAPVGVTVVE